MPVIVVGADTERGRTLVERLAESGGEVRAFISTPDEFDPMRARGAKVALGDISDASHIEGAARGAFCAITLLEAVADGRELAFSTPERLPGEWFGALRAADITRLIVVGDAIEPPEGFPEVRVVPLNGRPEGEIVDEILSLEGAASV